MTTEFETARTELRDLAREEKWAAAAAVLARLPRLASTDAEQALAAQDLGAFYRSQGKAADAAEAYETALSYARDVEPLDTLLLAGALTDMGDVAMERRRPDLALPLYEELLALRRAQAEDGAVESRRLLSLALERFADAREARGHRSRALDLYRESLVIAEALAALDPARFGDELTMTRERVTELEEQMRI